MHTNKLLSVQMKSLIVFGIVYAPVIFTFCLLFTMNHNNSHKPILSKLWRVFAYLIGAYVIMAFAMLLIGLDSFVYFETPEAKDLRKHNILLFLCWGTIVSLLGFKDAYPKDR